MGQPEGAEGSVELIPGSWADAFEAGQSFTINDGVGSGWYIVPPVAVNGQGGDDQRVLVAQLTTDGDISGQFRTQVFPEGDQINDVRADLTFTHTRACSAVTIDVQSETIAGVAPGNYTVVRTFTATDDCGNRPLQLKPSRLRTRRHLSSRAFLPITRLSAPTRCQWTTPLRLTTAASEHHCGERDPRW